MQKKKQCFYAAYFQFKRTKTLQVSIKKQQVNKKFFAIQLHPVLIANKGEAFAHA